MTLFLAFLRSFIGEGDKSLLLFFYVDFISTEFFFKIDFPPVILGLLTVLLASLLSSPNPKFSLTSLLITNWLLPKILCWLPSSESESFLVGSYFYLIPSFAVSIDFLLFFRTIPSIPSFDILSNFDLLGWLLDWPGYYF